ncbi:MAG: glycoside hydrolase family 9 protein [Lewinellaceae bacterium]|nr:glycoside hydrolase family 9 protein [Phaeodactylibacter sp.]MCB9040038.1 glycoside hydrolase family 9 protein [Lewinellaceae bacterium]
MTKHLLLLALVLACPGPLLSQQSWIRINQLGYTPQSIKVAVLGCREDISVASFEVVDLLTEETVFQSRKISAFPTYACFNKIYRLDFSSFEDEGTFYVKAGAMQSPPFRIAKDIYDGAADFLLNYMRQQRCGYNPYLRDSCHTQDGFIVDHPQLEGQHIDVTGGWHDASDYLQYVTTSANATYQMLFAYQQRPKAFGDQYDAAGLPGPNGIPDILDEAKWGLDWLDKMNPSYGMMFNQIADDRDHLTFTLPTLDSVDYGKGLERPVYFVTGKPQGLAKYKNRTTGVSSTAAKYASAFALGAELLKAHYPEFCQRISAKAFDAYAFAKTDLGVCQTASNRAPYFYEEDNYVDDMELAAAQLFRHTKGPNFLKEATYWGQLEPATPWMITDTARHYQWYPFVNLGHYLVAQSADSLGRAQFTSFLQQGLEAIYQRGKENGFFRGVPYIWCSNNLVAAALTQARLYHELTGDGRYLEMEAAMRDWLLGCNPWGTSMIVGFPQGADTPTDPHSAFTAKYGYPIDGGLVDGPIYTSTFKKLIGLKIVNGDEYAEFQSNLCVYHDDWGDYSTNEPTMDGTASLTFYLSAMEEEEPELYPGFTYREGAIIRGDTTAKTIHLVFTGGDYNDGGEHIRQVLQQQQVPAHFFFTGDFYRNADNEALIQGLKADGHYLGPHSDRHLLYAPWDKRDSLLVSKEQFIQDLQANYREMARFGIQKQDAPFFLPPYEWYNATISQWTKELGLQLINFSPGTRSNADYTTPDLGERYRSSGEIMESILNHEKNSSSGLNGFILLLHIGTHPDRTDKFYFQLEELIRELKKRGYGFGVME